MRFFLVHELSCSNGAGRLRARACRPMTQVQAEILADTLDAIDGVEGVRVNPRVPSVLVLYRHAQARQDVLRSLAAQDAGALNDGSVLATLTQELESSLERHASGSRLPAHDEDEMGAHGFGPLMRFLFVRPFLPFKLRVASSVMGALPFLRKGLASLLQGKLNVDVLDAAAIGVSLLRRDFRTVTVLTLLLGLGEALEYWTRRRSMDSLTESLALNVDTVWVLADGVETSVPLSDVREGDLVVVRDGGSIPVDGIVEDGEAVVNQASMTGEPLGVARSKGAAVYSGTVVEQGHLVIRATHVGDGTRLKPEILAVTMANPEYGDLSIAEVSALSVRECAEFLHGLALGERERMIAGRVLKEVQARLGFLLDVGLDYLSLDRAAGTLSGGEAQRIRLATQIGSGLVGVLYVLDEPSIGLHQRDNHRLLETLSRLRDLGNTLIVVEHDEDTVRSADWVVDIGPGAGEHGGQVVHSGPFKELLDNERSLTGDYLARRKRIRRSPRSTAAWSVRVRHHRASPPWSLAEAPVITLLSPDGWDRVWRTARRAATCSHPLPRARSIPWPVTRRTVGEWSSGSGTSRETCCTSAWPPRSSGPTASTSEWFRSATTSRPATRRIAATAGESGEFFPSSRRSGRPSKTEPTSMRPNASQPRPTRPPVLWV